MSRLKTGRWSYLLLGCRWDGPTAAQTLRAGSVNSREEGCGVGLTDLCLKVISVAQSGGCLYSMCCATAWVPSDLLNISRPN